MTPVHIETPEETALYDLVAEILTHAFNLQHQRTLGNDGACKRTIERLRELLNRDDDNEVTK